MSQTRLRDKEQKPYSYGPYNKVKGEEQWIRITEGCPHNCPFCREPTEFKIFGIPEIVRNKVGIMDMNLLAKLEALSIIKELGEKRVNGKVVYYEAICGVDYRFLTQEIANALKEARFRRIRIAWDWSYTDQYKLKTGIDKLLKAGYKSKDIMIFMICNWKITYKECLAKLDLCKIWRVQVGDCYYDNQPPSRKIKPEFWTYENLREFRCRVRKHNQLVRHGIDPEITTWGTHHKKLKGD